VSVLARYAADYAAALDAHVVRADEATLRAGYELGRRAVAEDVSALDLASIHHQALARSIGPDDRPQADVLAAGAEFFQELLSAYEMVHRGYREAAAAAAAERRHTAMLRQLSSFLADASLTVRQTEAVEEVLRLVVEYARELTGAAYGEARYDGGDAPVRVASADGEGVGDTGELVDGALDVPTAQAWVEASAAARTVLTVPMEALDGRPLGSLRLRHGGARIFSAADEALATHLCGMAAASLERAALYRLGVPR